MYGQESILQEQHAALEHHTNLDIQTLKRGNSDLSTDTSYIINRTMSTLLLQLGDLLLL